MKTIREIAKDEDITKWAVQKRMRTIPNFRTRYTRVDASQNGTILINDKGAEILHQYSKIYGHDKSHKSIRDHAKDYQKDAQYADQSSGDNNTLANMRSIWHLKAQVEVYQARLKDKNDSVHAKEAEIERLQQQLAKAQEITSQTQTSHLNTGQIMKQLTQEVTILHKQVAALPAASKTSINSNQAKRGFWSRIFGN